MAAVYLQLLQVADGGGHEAIAHDVYRLMREYVWQRLEKQAQEALLMLSLFHSFTVQQVLDLLEVQALPLEVGQVLTCRGFIRYDVREKRYYFHAILLELLRELFEQQGEAFRRRANLAGGLWSEKVGNKLMAVACYHAAGDYRRLFAVTLVDVELHTAGELCSVEMIKDILTHCPMEVKRDYPLSLLAFCYELFSAGQYEAYMQLCGEIGQMVPDLPLPEQERDKLLGELALMQSFAFYNDIEKMSACHQEAYALIKGASRLVDGTVPWTMGCPSVLYMYHRGTGRLEEELAHMRACLPTYTQLAAGHGSGGAQMMDAEALLYRGQWESAQEKCLQGAFLAERFGQSSLLVCAAFLKARMAALSADVEGLSVALEELEASRAQGVPSLECEADMALGHLWCLLGHPEKVAPWLAEGAFAAGELPLPAIPFAQMVHLQYCLAVKNYTRLHGLGELFVEDARGANNLIPQIVIPVLLASAHYRSGNLGEAKSCLDRALELALPDGLLLPFAEHADDLLPLLGAMTNPALQSGMAAIRAMADGLRRAREHCRPRSGAGQAPYSLTAREYEVALLAASRRSNGEIAESTGISVATVRTHLQAVYGKLGIDSTLKSKRNLLENRLKEEGIISYR